MHGTQSTIQMQSSLTFTDKYPKAQKPINIRLQIAQLKANSSRPECSPRNAMRVSTHLLLPRRAASCREGWPERFFVCQNSWRVEIEISAETALGSLGLQFPSQLSNTAKLIQSKNSPVHPSSLHSAHQPWPSLEASWLKPWRSSPAQSVLPGAWRCDHPYLGAWHNGQVSLPHGKRHHKAKVLWVVISFFAMCVRSLGRGTRITRGKMAGWDWTTALLINLCSPSSVNFNQTNELAL